MKPTTEASASAWGDTRANDLEDGMLLDVSEVWRGWLPRDDVLATKGRQWQ